MLAKIEVENLGPIKKTSLELSPLTVLLGANASGKTSVLRAVELFARVREQLVSQISFGDMPITGTGWAQVVHEGEADREIVIRGWRTEDVHPLYEVALGVDWERVRAGIAEGAPVQSPVEVLWEVVRNRDSVRAKLGLDFEERITGIPTDTKSRRGRPGSLPWMMTLMKQVPAFTQEARGQLGDYEALGTARYFRVVRPRTSPWFESGTPPRAAEFIEGLAAYLNRDVEGFLRLEHRLRELFPHVEHVRILTEEDLRTLVFETERSRSPTPASLEADGVLTTLYLLWIAFTSPPDATILLDEPEIALHPHLMGKRVELLRDLASGKITGSPMRVVVATQSVDFVKWLDLSEIRTVEYSPELGTVVSAVRKDETLTKLIDQFQANVGDLWYSGHFGGTPGTAS